MSVEELGPRDSNADFRDQNPASCQLDEGPWRANHDTVDPVAADAPRIG